MNMLISRAMARDHGAFLAKLAKAPTRYERKDEPIAEIKKILHDQGSAFDEFKKTVDARDKEYARKGVEDPIYTQKIENINKALDDYGVKLKAAADQTDKLETVIKRNGGVTPEESKSVEAETKAFNIALKAQAGQYGRPAPAEFDADGYKAYKSGLAKFIREGERNFTDIERKAMSVGSDPDGGYLVTPDTTGQMVRKIFESSPVRQVASVQTISTDSLEGLTDKDQNTSGGWVTETGTRATTASAQWAKWSIPVHEQFAQPTATQKLLDDASINVESWLAEKTADILIRTENTAFVSGTAAGRPRGFASYTTAATADSTRSWGTMEHYATGTNGALGTGGAGAADTLIAFVHRLKSAYRNGAVWAMNRNLVGSVRQLKDGNGSYVWLPSMMAGQPSSLLGYPVVEMEDMAAIATDALPIAFGNFKLGYQIVDRQGIRVLRDPYTSKPYVLFYTTKRVGADVLNFEAIKFLKTSTS